MNIPKALHYYYDKEPGSWLYVISLEAPDINTSVWMGHYWSAIVFEPISKFDYGRCLEYNYVQFFLLKDRPTTYLALDVMVERTEGNLKFNAVTCAPVDGDVMFEL